MKATYGKTCFFNFPCLLALLAYLCISCADDMPAGQTPHNVQLYAHNDLVDKVQAGQF